MMNASHRFNGVNGTNGTQANDMAKVLFDAYGQPANIRKLAENFPGNPMPTANASSDVLSGWGGNDGYLASHQNRLTNHLPTFTKPTNDELRFGLLSCLRARSRFVYKNHPYANGAINTIVRRVFGNGFKYQSKMKPKKSKKRNRLRDENQELEDIWEAIEQKFTNTNDPFRVFRRKVGINWFVDGECTAIAVDQPHKPIEIDGKLVRYSRRWQIIDSDQYAEDRDENTLEGVEPGNKVLLGIEFNPDDEAVAYHFYDDGADLYGRFNNGSAQYGFYSNSLRKTKRVPVERVLHLFDKKFPNQVRGIPLLTPVLMHVSELEDYERAALTQAWVQACYTAFIHSDMPAEMQQLMQGADLATVQGEFINWMTGNNWSQKELEPGQILHLNPYTDVKFANPSAPGPQCDKFVSLILHAIAAGLDRSYTSVARDLKGVSFSGGRQDEISDQQSDNDLSEQSDALMFSPIWARFHRPSISRTSIDANSGWGEKFPCT